MKKYILLFCPIFFILSALPASAAFPYPHIYKFYMELGKLALDQGDFQEAYGNFRHAQAVAPDEKEPAIFINLIKRLQDERIEPKPITKVFRPFKKSRAQIIDEALDEFSARPPVSTGNMDVETGRLPTSGPVERINQKSEKFTAPRAAGQTITPPLHPVPKGSLSRQQNAAPAKGWVNDVPGGIPPGLPAEGGKNKTGPRPSERGASPDEPQGVVYLDNNLWQTQPGTLIRVELRKSVILDAKNIKRYLIITPGFFDVERIDKGRINIISKRRGSTIFHVWDDTGRWTFHVEVILPVRKIKGEMTARQSERHVDPFKISYSADWSSFYLGSSLDKVERKNLNFLQQILLEGETPYGDYDSHVIINKFDASTEVTGYGIGLTNGKIGHFKDFSIRGFDIQKVFSPLSMPGQFVRGVLLEAEAFNHKVAYSYMRGRDRQVFGFLSPDVLEKQESFVEGARVTLFPEQDNQYSINYARGYGDAREPFLKDQVFSFEARHRWNDVLFSGEFAYDETATALTAKTQYNGDHHSITVSFRDLESDFTTVTSLPGNRGEVGGSIFWDWRLRDADINTRLDLYRERFLPNPEEEDAVNVDFSTAIDVPLSTTDRFRASVYYTDTSGELSPRNNERVNTTYTKHFRLGKRDITTFAGLTQQRSRFDLSPASEFDRYSATSGFTIPLIKHLNYYVNYENSWVYEEQSGDLLMPNVFNTGMNYSKQLTDDWSIHSAFSYRNEENTQGTNSFLAGEDNITGSLGATFRPNEDFEFFLDGRTRNVWAEEESRSAFNEIDVRAGVRTAWGLPFRWDPKGTVAGSVYKDLNRNQKQDAGEDGMPDVVIKIGKRTVVTGSDGYYHSAVRAKSVDVVVDINSIPDGFIFSTPAIVDAEIIPHKIQRIDFGLTTQSGIYGIVYHDANGNGKPDSGDDFVAKARIILDGEQIVNSDFEGTYSFESVQPGRHQISIDVNSLPIDYLPKVKLKNAIDVSEGSTYIFHVPLSKIHPKK